MKKKARQMELGWLEQKPLDEPSEVALDPATIDAVIALMARALIVVVRIAGEVADER
jgi:hypothetical protein